MPVYGLEGTSIEGVAESLSEVLQIPLFPQRSPMIGPWYTNLDLQAVLPELASGQSMLSEDGPNPELVLNDPEPGYTGPEFPGGGDLLLRVDGSAEEIANVEEQLHLGGLHFQRLKE
jgi:hypothetical protein